MPKKYQLSEATRGNGVKVVKVLEDGKEYLYNKVGININPGSGNSLVIREFGRVRHVIEEPHEDVENIANTGRDDLLTKLDFFFRGLSSGTQVVQASAPASTVTDQASFVTAMTGTGKKRIYVTRPITLQITAAMLADDKVVCIKEISTLAQFNAGGEILILPPTGQTIKGQTEINITNFLGNEEIDIVNGRML